MCTYVHKYIYIYIYMHIQRDAQRERATHTQKEVAGHPAQGWTNRTLAVHERVNSRFLVLPGSLSIFTPDYWAQMF